ncbi:hypothetical protein AnigIFM56816_000161 [Aspergillus niger]|nr:hypothetical protein AnigIFM56816_000161 [Aspergillus niger]
MATRISKFTLLKRRSDLTHDEYNEHWHTTHAHVLASLPAFWKYSESYVQNHLLPMPASLAGDADVPFDGIAKTYQTTRDDMNRQDFFTDPSYLTIVREDELKFLSIHSCTSIYGTEHIIKDGPTSGVKYLSFLRRSESLDQETFLSYWLTQHAPLVKSVESFYKLVRRYVQHHGLLKLHRAMSEEGSSETFSGVVELYFDSIEDLETAFNLPEYLETIRQDERKFLCGSSMRFIVKERPVLKPKGLSP